MKWSPPRFLVVAFPRSGTKFFAYCLNECFGLDVGHEHVHHNGAVGFNYVEGMNARPGVETFDMVIHLVRDPRRAISSAFVNITLAGWSPDQMENYWCDWNVRCEQTIDVARQRGVPTMRARIENIKETFETISCKMPQVFRDRLLYEHPVPDPDPANEHTNHRKEYPVLSWKTLRPTTKFFARRYGYF